MRTTAIGVCGEECEVYSRVTGYHRPTKLWNKGKQEEMKQRKFFKYKLTFVNGEPVIKK